MLALPFSRRDGLPGFFGADFSTGQDEDYSVYFAAYNGGVGDDQDGRHVEEDVVIVFIDFFQQVHHAGRSQEFCRVWRHGTAGYDVEIGEDVFLDDLTKGYVFGKAVGQPFIGQFKPPVQYGLSQVTVDKEDFFIILSHDDSQVGYGRRFAFFWNN